MNTTTLAPFKPRLPMPANIGVPPGMWKVLTDAIFPAAKSAESVVLALEYCRARNLDILKRPVNVVPVWSSQLGRYVEQIWPSINEIEVTAARSGEWAGMDKPEFGPLIERTFTGRVKSGGNEWRNESVTLTFPEWVSVTVYRIVAGERSAFTEPVYWQEIYGRQQGTELPNATWIKRTRAQAIKVAKATSLRAAFPEEADYSADEMEGGVIDAAPVAGPAPADNWSPPTPSASPSPTPSPSSSPPSAATPSPPPSPLPTPTPPPSASTTPSLSPSPSPESSATPTPPPTPSPAPMPTPTPTDLFNGDEVIDHETGEVLTMPRQVGADGVPEDFKEWGIRFVNRLMACVTLDEVDAVVGANAAQLEAMKAEAPKVHVRIAPNVQRAKASIVAREQTPMDAG